MAPHSYRESASPSFIILGFGLGKRAGPRAIKVLKRPARFCWRLVPNRRVQPDVFVVGRQLSAGVLRVIERFVVWKLAAQAAIMRLDESTLLRLARIDQMPVRAIVARPFQDRTTCKLRLVVSDNTGRPYLDKYWGIQFPRHPGSEDAGIGDRAQVIETEIIETARIQTRRDAPNVLNCKLSDQRSPGLSTSGTFVREPGARLRSFRRVSPSFLSVKNRSNVF